MAWLPLFVGGLTELQEPYRFMAIEGTRALVAEAGARLHLMADALAPALHSCVSFAPPPPRAPRLPARRPPARPPPSMPLPLPAGRRRRLPRRPRSPPHRRQACAY